MCYSPAWNFEKEVITPSLQLQKQEVEKLGEVNIREGKCLPKVTQLEYMSTGESDPRTFQGSPGLLQESVLGLELCHGECPGWLVYLQMMVLIRCI